MGSLQSSGAADERADSSERVSTLTSRPVGLRHVEATSIRTDRNNDPGERRLAIAWDR